MLQAFEVLQSIKAIAGVAALGLEQTDAVVVVQGADGYASQFREFADAIRATHSSIDNSRP
jgi:hypothetical protein